MQLWIVPESVIADTSSFPLGPARLACPMPANTRYHLIRAKSFFRCCEVQHILPRSSIRAVSCQLNGFSWFTTRMEGMKPAPGCRNGRAWSAWHVQSGHGHGVGGIQLALNGRMAMFIEAYR